MYSPSLLLAGERPKKLEKRSKSGSKKKKKKLSNFNLACEEQANIDDAMRQQRMLNGKF
jgi:hypothetical protein